MITSIIREVSMKFLFWERLWASMCLCSMTTRSIYVSMQYDHYEHLCVYAVRPLEQEGTYKVILHAIM